jgi:hypothetical protein
LDLGSEARRRLQGRTPSGLSGRRRGSGGSPERSAPVTSMTIPAKQFSRRPKLNVSRYLDNGRGRSRRRICQPFDPRHAHTFSSSCQPLPENWKPRRTFKRDVKIVGTNSISHLESTKVSKNELKRGRNEVGKCAARCVKGGKTRRKIERCHSVLGRFRDASHSREGGNPVC